jgi:hypothetical protein
MVKLDRIRGIVGGVAVLALGAAAWLLLRPHVAPSPSGPAPIAGRAGGKSHEVPRIDLARITAPPSRSGAGESDIFRFGAPSTKATVRPTSPSAAANAPAAPVIEAPATPPPAPVMNVKYIGSVADKRGLKVAVLMTDRKEVLTGRAGDVVANRLKIVNIGLESVDVQDLGSDRVRRIPLRAN